MNKAKVASECCKEHTEKHNGWSVELPCAVGAEVWYKYKLINLLGSDYVKCIVDSYKIDTSCTRVHLISIDENVGFDIWTNIDNFGTSILLDDPNINDIHLYQAIALYNLNRLNHDIKFEINELPIHHIEDDCTIITEKFYDVENGRVSNKFAGVNSFHTMKDIKIGDDYFVFYSTNEKRCRNFIFNHLSRFETNLSKYHERIYYLRQKLKKN